MKRLFPLFLAAALIITAIYPASGASARSRLDVQRGGRPSFEPVGSGLMFGALDPVVQRWYVPQELYNEYRWQHRDFSNYSRYHYQRYVSTALEGDYFYDFFGDYVSRGWLIYDWRQEQPGDFGSSLFKDDKFGGWFSGAVVSADSRGQYSYAVTLGNELRTTLTPLTFSKPRFNGVQLDFAADRFAATFLASRISTPQQAFVQAVRNTHTTGLIGGRATFQVSDRIEVGATLVDARHSNTELGISEGHFIAGNLARGQSSHPAGIILVVLGDDSPEDGRGGAALFGHNSRITVRNFETGEETVYSQDEVVREGLEWPRIFGGFPRQGALVADGEERIVLNYDFSDVAFQLPEGDASNIVNVEFDYVIANDYTIDVWSDRHLVLGSGSQASSLQTSAILPTPVTPQVLAEEEPFLLPVRRAVGNVDDLSNMQRVDFEYGLPTANLVGGFTIEGTDLFGFDLYGEWDRNVRYSQYPNAVLFRENKDHEISSRSADAWYATLSRSGNPWFLYGEAYSISHDYSTSAFVVDRRGSIIYNEPAVHVYEFVDDNDDQDLHPEWVRSGESRIDNDGVFPGWDENGDFISDFNQNNTVSVPNEIPDYEEPFLRHDVDRPEFLFGIDMNNNGWIDRFEDDDLPDYPYKADRRGYNAFAGADLVPGARLLLGRNHERMFSQDRDNNTVYGLFTFDGDYPGFGRVRFFEAFKRTSDSIPDDRRGIGFTRTADRPVVGDVLPAQDTWINTAWLGLDYTALEAFRAVNKLKWEFYRQRNDDAVSIDGDALQKTSGLFGMINKVEYRRSLGAIDLTPRYKSEFLSSEGFLRNAGDRREWTGIASLIARFPVLRQSSVTTGLEYAREQDIARDEEELMARGVEGETGDSRSLIFGLQFGNTSRYLGFRLITQVGFLLDRTSREVVEPSAEGPLQKGEDAGTEVTTFITVYAGLR